MASLAKAKPWALIAETVEEYDALTEAFKKKGEKNLSTRVAQLRPLLEKPVSGHVVFEIAALGG